MKVTGRSIGSIASMLLFCAFTASLLLVLASGAGAYKDIKQVADKRFSENACISYIATKVRHYDSDGGVAIGSIGDVPALMLSETIEGENYVTSLYYYDGNIMELFAPAGLDFAPEDGMPVLESQGLSFSVTSVGTLSVNCVGKDFGQASVELSLRSGEVAVQ